MSIGAIMAGKDKGNMGRIKSPEEQRAEKNAAKARKAVSRKKGQTACPKPSVQHSVVQTPIAASVQRHERFIATRSRQAQVMRDLVEFPGGFSDPQGRHVRKLQDDSPAASIIFKAIDLFAAGKKSCVDDAIKELGIQPSPGVVTLVRMFNSRLVDTSWAIESGQTTLEQAYARNNLTLVSA